MDLQGKKIAILATHGFEQSELEVPRDRLKKAGATVEIVSLAGGDDYELCFTAPVSKRNAVAAAASAAATAVTRVGSIEAATGLRLTDADGAPLDLQLSSFDHFKSP